MMSQHLSQALQQLRKDEENYKNPRGRVRTSTNRNDRGSSYDRRARKRWLLTNFGDGTVCPCAFCGCDLTFNSITVDRITPACEGGTYRRDNIRPACWKCNTEDGQALGQARKNAKNAASGKPRKASTPPQAG